MFSNRSRTVIGFTFFFIWTAYVFAAQTYYSPISINSAQVPSTQTDFPVLVSQTDNRFKTVGNGGHVANANGYDIRPYSDSGLTTAITGYELERYNATTGEVVMWVKVGSLTSSSTPIYLGYGDTSLTTDGSSTTTWSNSFTAVYHLKDGTTLSVADSTGAHNGGNSGVTATTGKIDGAGGFSTANVDLGVINEAAISYSAWVNGSAFTNSYNRVLCVDAGGGVAHTLAVKSNGKLAILFYATALVFYDGTGANTLSTSTWYYIVGTYSSGAGLVGYVNASSDNTAAANGAAKTDFAAHTAIGTDLAGGSNTFTGTIDEVRISSVARSANWITTEYNNQSAPGTFETLGTEVPLASPTPTATPTPPGGPWLMFFPR